MDGGENKLSSWHGRGKYIFEEEENSPSKQPTTEDVRHYIILYATARILRHNIVVQNRPPSSAGELFSKEIEISMHN